jgi:peroxiredoxin
MLKQVHRVPLFLLAGLLGLAGTGLARGTEKQPSRAMLGQKVPNLTFKTAAGKTLSLYDVSKPRAVVLVFLSFDCPVSTSYSKSLADIHRRLSPHGVHMIGLTTNEDQTPQEVARLAKSYDLPFQVIIDQDLKAADALKANITPEVFVLDSDLVLRYRGRIDNGYYARLKRNHEVSAFDLQQALGEVLSGRPVSNPATESIGCAIQRELKNVAKDGPVTYYRDVLPIVQRNCQQCHRPGEVGQFSLLTYRQAVNWADDIKSYTRKHFMPPWKPTAGLPFHNERKLTDKEIATLAAWADGGTPAGNPKDAPPPASFTEGWFLGQPDLVLTVPSEMQIGPSGRDLFRCFVLPTNLTEDHYVTAVEVRPGNPRIVHHALLAIDTTGKGRQLQKAAEQTKEPAISHDGPSLDKGPGYPVSMGFGFIPQGGLSGWAPGLLPRHLPEGYGYFLPKNADVVLQVHYHRDGRLEKDQTRVGLYFAKKPETRRYQGGIIAGGLNLLMRPGFTIPAGENHYKLSGTMWATADCKLFSIMPHMHLLGKEIKITLAPPDGKATTLLEIKDWDYNWQETYFFKEPVQVKKGSRLDVVAYFDNSAENPNNPNRPPQPVSYGEQTTNEMCFVFLGGTSASGRRLPLSPLPLGRQPLKRAAR